MGETKNGVNANQYAERKCVTLKFTFFSHHMHPSTSHFISPAIYLSYAFEGVHVQLLANVEANSIASLAVTVVLLLLLLLLAITADGYCARSA